MSNLLDFIREYLPILLVLFFIVTLAAFIYILYKMNLIVKNTVGKGLILRCPNVLNEDKSKSNFIYEIYNSNSKEQFISSFGFICQTLTIDLTKDYFAFCGKEETPIMIHARNYMKFPFDHHYLYEILKNNNAPKLRFFNLRLTLTDSLGSTTKYRCKEVVKIMRYMRKEENKLLKIELKMKKNELKNSLIGFEKKQDEENTNEEIKENK